ncbi:MAG: SHOCT domain-containing protein [Trueperaceae bacterium]|nr:SHOCT domain-containing protein [Trueperaceae bacterium]
MGILLILGLVAVVVWFARSGDLARWVGQRGGPTVDPALETLRRRYALGEIDADEFARRKADLA